MLTVLDALFIIGWHSYLPELEANRNVREIRC